MAKMYLPDLSANNTWFRLGCDSGNGVDSGKQQALSSANKVLIIQDNPFTRAEINGSAQGALYNSILDDIVVLALLLCGVGKAHNKEMPMDSKGTPVDTGALRGTEGMKEANKLSLAGLIAQAPQAQSQAPGDKDLVAQIVSAYVTHHNLSPVQLIELMRDVRDFIASSHWPRPDQGRKEPFVPVEQSVHPDYIICLEDGARYKSLKRYLARRYNMTPEEYRRKWSLPDSYPMVAPNFSQSRSIAAKAKRMGGRRFSRVEAVQQAGA